MAGEPDAGVAGEGEGVGVGWGVGLCDEDQVCFMGEGGKEGEFVSGEATCIPEEGA